MDNQRGLLAATIRQHIKDLNTLLADARDQGLSLNISDERKHASALQQLVQRTYYNRIGERSTFYVHSITHTKHEEY